MPNIVAAIGGTSAQLPRGPAMLPAMFQTPIAA